ncbi:MAG TPA: hypothetical protein PLD48_06675 [Bacillota bacterium]|nr:hypothetical protein [Bacillota bacterium]HOK68935.1 hypothetical protein [Bacillota bacterium]HPP85279.1 hypothetical protein [Bacillota bacterium]
MRAKKSLSKKFITIGLVFSFLLAMVAPEVPVFTETVNAEGSLFAGGDGTASNPYIIKTPEQLYNVGKFTDDASRNKYFKRQTIST